MLVRWAQAAAPRASQAASTGAGSSAGKVSGLGIARRPGRLASALRHGRTLGTKGSIDTYEITGQAVFLKALKFSIEDGRGHPGVVGIIGLT